jgi:hypothetical protein
MDLREIGWGGVDWIDLAQDRDQWRALVNTVMNLRVLLSDLFLAYFPYIEKIEQAYEITLLSVCLCSPPINVRMPEPIFMKFGTYTCIMAPGPISTAYLINPSHQSVCLYVYPPIVVRQRLGKNPPNLVRQRLGRNVTAVTNIHATIEELLDASFSMWPVSYQGK